MSTPPPTNDAMMRQLVDTVPDLLFLCRYDDINAQAGIVACNATACAVTGLSEQEMLGATPRSLMTPDTTEPEDPNMRRMVFQRARELGMVEVPNTIRLPLHQGSPRLRIRIVWPDANDTLVLFQIEIVRD